MNSTKLNCPPLTPDDILTIKGKPAARITKLDKQTNLFRKEEWIYYNEHNKTKEHYFFRNGYLTNWKKGSV